MQKYVHEVLVNRLVNVGQEKSVVRWADLANMTLAVGWDVKNNKKTKKNSQIRHTSR